jgi:N,N'-diacetyllegionaminate synthase
MKMIKIGKRKIGLGNPCFIIAEAGVNHNGDVIIAKKLIDVAVAAGADAVKFQTFRTEEVMIHQAEKAEYQKFQTDSSETQFDMVKKLELSENNFFDLSKYASKRGIVFLSTPFDLGSVDVLEKIGVPVYKIPSGEITNYPLLKKIASFGKPIILSTGMANLGEIESALKILKLEGANNIILLHCITSYPALYEDLNLKVIKTLECSFHLPVGFSDHSLGLVGSIGAVALGAVVIEKHFTLDNLMEGPDHKSSLNPEELKNLVEDIRILEKSLGTGDKSICKNEQEIKKVARKSIVARTFIKKNQLITEEMVSIKRPGTGIESRYLPIVVGKKSKKDLTPDSMIRFEDLYD